MTVSLVRLDPAEADRADLVAFLTRQDWPFHVERHPSAAQVAEAIGAGAYRSEDRDTFWLVDDAGERVGFARLEDLSDGAPLFDLRLDAAARGRGLGAAALRALTDHVFTTMPEVDRFEGQTREDNRAMRKTFARCGFVKEAHYRRGWPVEGGEPVASVAYAILRGDWETGRTTPVNWGDLP